MTTFTLPHRLEASTPPARRDDVRLMVAAPGRIDHVAFTDFAAQLRAGDLVVVNTSGTLAAALDGYRAAQPVTLHLATVLDDATWVVEIRPRERAEGPLDDVRPGDVVTLPDAVRARVVAPHPVGQRRLWRAQVDFEGGAVDYLARHGRPIRYGYVPVPQPIEQYQTVFAREAGSAEMPSAGRPFTDGIVTDLVTSGVAVAPILLHTGVSSTDAGEAPQAERYRVPEVTARAVNHTRASGGRVVAVGTTVTRALESVAGADGLVRGGAGWTELVLGLERPARVVNGLVTGWHAPGASHLDLLRAVAGHDLVERAYDAALRHEYLWHEFGDSCLLLP